MDVNVGALVVAAGKSLSSSLVKHAAKRLKEAAFGPQETKALRRAYEHAFGVLLGEVAAELDEVNRDHLRALFESFVQKPDVADLLLDLSLSGSELPVEELRARFYEHGFDRETLTVSFDNAMSALVRGLAEGLSDEAIKPESPLYNRVSFGRLIALQLYLEQNQRNWFQALRVLREIEGHLKQHGPREIIINGDLIGNLMLHGDNAVVQQSILQLPPDLRQFAETVRDAVAEAQRAAGDDQFDAALRDYLRALQLYCVKHPYLSLDKYLRDRRNSLGEVYVPLVAQAGQEEHGGKLVNVAEYLREVGASKTPKHILITGSPGGGKSTLLRQTAGHAWVPPDNAGQNARYLPMVVRLQALALTEGEPSLEKRLLKALGKAGDLVLAVNPPENFIAEWSRRTNARWLFLLDGLDEVPSSDRALFLRWLDDFVKTVHGQGHHVVITSRPAAELNEELGGGFDTYSLLLFTGEQQREFASRWFGDQAEEFFDEVRRVETEYLNATPLLLTIAAVVYGPPQWRLPDRQAELYEKFVDIWLAEAEAGRLKLEVGERLSQAVHRVLEHLALAMTEDPGDNSEETLARETTEFLRNAFGMASLEAEIEGKNFIEALGRHSGLLSSEGKVYGWLHPTLREYMAARALDRRLKSSGGDFNAVLGERPFNEEWAEVCVYLASVMQQPRGLIEWLSARAVERNDAEAAFLIRECWSKSTTAEDKQSLSALVDALMVSLGDDRHPHVKREAIETLVWIGPRVVDDLLNSLESITERINGATPAADPTTSPPGGDLNYEQ